MLSIQGYLIKPRALRGDDDVADGNPNENEAADANEGENAIAQDDVDAAREAVEEDPEAPRPQPDEDDDDEIVDAGAFELADGEIRLLPPMNERYVATYFTTAVVLFIFYSRVVNVVV